MSELIVNSSMLGLNQVNVHIEDSGGTGRPVILLHGWPLSAKSWDLQVPVLKDAGYRVITYDRRGFGESDKPPKGYEYDTLSDDLAGIINGLGLHDVTIVGFSMGGGEVARYIKRRGEDRLRSVVFASAITPMMLQSDDNPKGPLSEVKADEMTQQLTNDADSFYDQFTKDFFSSNANGAMVVTEAQRHDALSQCQQADMHAALQAMHAFVTTDFRRDLAEITIPTLILHGDSDGIVPFEGSGKRTHTAIAHSTLHVVTGGPHGINISHADEFNKALITFLAD